MRFVNWLLSLKGPLTELTRQTASVIKATWEVLAVSCLCLCAVEFGNLSGIATTTSPGAPNIFSLLSSLIITPLAAGMITYAVSASWEGRRVTLIDACQLVRIRFGRVILTGLCAGFAVFFVEWAVMLINALVGMLPALLGWIPVVGTLVTAIASVVIWLVTLVMTFVTHVALVTGMLTLTADGLWGRAQLHRAISILRGDRTYTLPRMILIYVFWVAIQALMQLIGWQMGASGIILIALLGALLTVLSTTAVSVMYLKVRDHIDGIHFSV